MAGHSGGKPLRETRVEGGRLVRRALAVGVLAQTGATSVGLVWCTLSQGRIVSLPDLFAGIVLPCALAATVLAAWSMRISRGGPLPARVLSLVLWTAATPTLWAAGWGFWFIVGSASWRNDEWGMFFSIFLSAVLIGSSLWCITLAPGFVMLLGRIALRDDVHTAHHSARGEALNSPEEWAEDAEVFTARSALREVFKKDA